MFLWTAGSNGLGVSRRSLRSCRLQTHKFAVWKKGRQLRRLRRDNYHSDRLTRCGASIFVVMKRNLEHNPTLARGIASADCCAVEAALIVQE